MRIARGYHFTHDVEVYSPIDDEEREILTIVRPTLPPGVVVQDQKFPHLAVDVHADDFALSGRQSDPLDLAPTVDQDLNLGQAGVHDSIVQNNDIGSGDDVGVALTDEQALIDS